MFRHYVKLGLVTVCLAGLSSCTKPPAQNPNALVQERACIQNLELKDYDAAEVRCQLCLEYDEHVPECLNGLGLIWFARGKDDKAISYFTKAIQISKNFAQARNNIAAVYFKSGDYAKPVSFLKAALEIDPGYEDARYNLGLALLKLGHQAGIAKDEKGARAYYEQALTEYQKLSALNPANPESHRDQGLIYTYLSELSDNRPEQSKEYLAKAHQFLQRCLQVSPSHETCHESIGYVLARENRPDDALSHYIQCLAANKLNVVCKEGVERAYQRGRLKSRALATYTDHVRKNPSDAQGHLALCKALFDEDMSELAVSECESALRLNNKMCGAYYFLANHYKKALNGVRAEQYCRSYLLCDVKPSNSGYVAKCQDLIVTGSSGR